MRAGVEAKASAWWIQRLFNMSTITREWVAMQHAHLMPFRYTEQLVAAAGVSSEMDRIAVALN